MSADIALSARDRRDSIWERHDFRAVRRRIALLPAMNDNPPRCLHVITGDMKTGRHAWCCAAFDFNGERNAPSPFQHKVNLGSVTRLGIGLPLGLPVAPYRSDRAAP